VTPATADCQQVDRMLGSRIAVANLELRFPLLRPFGLSPRMYGPIPVEVAFFLDGGRAWSIPGVAARGEAVPGGIWSTGVTLRTSVLGLGLGQIHLARPLAMRGARWTFQFQLAAPL
jgi:outer membrane protein assembly factor BamA